MSEREGLINPHEFHPYDKEGLENTYGWCIYFDGGPICLNNGGDIHGENRWLHDQGYGVVPRAVRKDLDIHPRLILPRWRSRKVGYIPTKRLSHFLITCSTHAKRPICNHDGLGKWKEHVQWKR